MPQAKPPKPDETFIAKGSMKREPATTNHIDTRINNPGKIDIDNSRDHQKPHTHAHKTSAAHTDPDQANQNINDDSKHDQR